jgi:hypothetical protein
MPNFGGKDKSQGQCELRFKLYILEKCILLSRAVRKHYTIVLLGQLLVIQLKTLFRFQTKPQTKQQKNNNKKNKQ